MTAAALNVTTIRKSVIGPYRIFSMIFLYGILFGIIFYGGLFAFFFSSTSWVAPFRVNPSDAPVLAITAQITSSQASINTLQLDIKSSQENAQFNKSQLASLFKLDKQLHSKVTDQKSVWSAASQDLTQFDSEAKKNIAVVTNDVSNGEEMRRLVKRDLDAGLITKEDALSTYSYIDMLAVNTTAAKIAENGLRDSIRQHKMEDITSLTVEGQHTALEFQINQIYSTIRTDEQHIVSDLETIATIQRAVDTAKQSPYFVAVSGKGVELAIAPYSPSSMPQAGAPVYSCYFGFIVCKRVGTIAATYPNELVFENPLTKTNTRGVIVQLAVTAEAMRTKALMIGHKPLFF